MRLALTLAMGVIGGGFPRSPSGFAYVYSVDANGLKQLVTAVDANGVTRPVYAAGTGS